MMSMYNKDGMMIGQYLQIPNSFVDRIVGPVCSGNAAWVVVTVWRYTHGIKDKNKERRQSAKIPTETFMRVLGTDREKTIYKYVKEAEETGLIEVTRKRGATNTYSINLKSKHWYDVEDVIVLDESDSKVLAESATPLQVLAESASGEKRHITRAESATPFDESTGEKRHPYKESSLNKSFKENNAQQENKNPESKKKAAAKKTSSVEKPGPVSQQVWDDLITLRKTKRAPLTQTAWNMALKEILIAQKETGHPMDQIISEWIVAGWVGFKSDWYANRAGGKPAIDRKTDKLAVNNNWENASQPTEIKSTVTFEEFMGEA